MGILKPRTTSVLIYHGDDMESLAGLRRAVTRAEAALVEAEDRAEKAARGPRRVADEVVSADGAREALTAAQDAYDAGVDDCAGRAVEVKLSALGSQRFRDLLAAHTPRLDDGGDPVADDAPFGVNTETFPKALLLFRDDVKRTITDPDCTDAELREFVEDEVSDGDFEDMWVTAFWLNKAQGVDPRLGKFSAGTPTLPVN